MTEPTRPTDLLLTALKERAKELDCLYAVEELLGNPTLDLDQIFGGVVRAIPPGWQFPEDCEAQITYEGETHRSRDFRPTSWCLRADLNVQGEVLGHLEVYYVRWHENADEGPFLKEEVRLVRTIADRLAYHVFYKRLQRVHDDIDRASEDLEARRTPDWQSPVHLLRRADKHLYLRIARKMINNLFWSGVEEAQTWLRRGSEDSLDDGLVNGEVNSPGRLREIDESWLLTDEPFELAARHLSDEEILTRLQRWMVEERANACTKILHSERSALSEIADALRRYHEVLTDVGELPEHTVSGIRVALIQKLLTEQVDFVKVAKEFIGTRAIERILGRVIMTGDSRGKLGGKAAGVILAHRILRKTPDIADDFKVKVPMSWFVPSSAMRQFIAHNDLEDVFEQKYKRVDEVRHDYPNIVRLFKSSRFPADVVKGFSVMLDELEDTPIVVRSSSLLEDRVGTAFSGKYKSLFLANQGTKRERLAELLDAVAEVYASTFGPDPIEYRKERGLLDFSEEMGILVQQVVGRRVGRYFLPAFAGVAFSNNEFRWSPRIRRDDGLIRVVPGLGSRAVDRVADDFPILVVPKQPNLRVNTGVDEVVRYSPKHVDAIDLQDRCFCTVDINDILADCGTDYPAFEQVFSVLEQDLLRRPVALLTDPETDDLVVTFDGLISSTPFVERMGRVLRALQDSMGQPVDIEFAHDGKHLYLLQCRAQSSADECGGAPIPRDVPAGDVLFSASRYVSNGFVPDLTHIVYVDPDAYGAMSTREAMVEVGRAVGKINKLLPRRRFALLGPGRWGSRGDIKLGVSVTYADINNAALLVEIARKRGAYVPDLSFGTHFFQDLVEAAIRYLPLYPDEDGNAFDGRFFRKSPNLLPDLLPDFAHLADVVKVIDVSASTEGRILRVLMNADLDEALAVLADPSDAPDHPRTTPQVTYHREPGEAWRWRMLMAERIAAEIDPHRFGVQAMYVFGSTKNATAVPGSDLDLLVHVRGTPRQRKELDVWLQGWSLALAQMNYLKTGYRSEGLLDVHYVTDEDIAERTSWAVKIGAVTDAARELGLGGR